VGVQQSGADPRFTPSFPWAKAQAFETGSGQTKKLRLGYPTREGM